MPEAAAADPDVYGAIASPVRRALIDRLATGPLPVHDLAADFAMTRPAVSQHLRVLRQAGLVGEARAGRERRYHLDGAPLQQVHSWVGHYETFWRDHLAALRDVLDGQP